MTRRYASGVVKIWDLSTHLLVTLPPSAPLPGEGEPGVRDGGGITALCFFDDTLVTASSTGVLQQWHFRYAPHQSHPSTSNSDAGHTESYLPRVASLRSLGRPSSDMGLCSRCGSHDILPGVGHLVRSGIPFPTLARRTSSPGPKFTLGGEGDADDWMGPSSGSVTGSGAGGGGGNGGGKGGGSSDRGGEVPPEDVSVLTFHRVFSKAVHKSAVSELIATTSNQLISTSRDNLIKLYVEYIFYSA